MLSSTDKIKTEKKPRVHFDQNNIIQKQTRVEISQQKCNPLVPKEGYSFKNRGNGPPGLVIKILKNQISRLLENALPTIKSMSK